MKKILRKTFNVLAVLFLILVVSAFAIPILFKKPITNLVKKEINKNLDATVDFKEVSVSLIKHFPKISISLLDLSVAGKNEFENDTLISTQKFEASVDLISAIKGSDINVYGVFIKSPRIHALVNKDGKTNWDIAKGSVSTPTDTSASAFKMNLQKYEISDGYIYYRDESSDISAEIVGLTHEGKGDFTEDIFTLDTKTKADAVDFTYASVPYLIKSKTDIETSVRIDNTNNKYDFKTDDITVNNLKLNAEGFFQLVNDSVYNMDIKFKTPSNEFKDILSLVPTIYKQDFDKIKTDGRAAFDGFVRGTYSPRQIPAYDVNLSVTNGFFQYPDLPKPVQNIQLAMHVSNPDGQPDNTIIDISKGHLEMDNEPFDFKLIFKNPETIQYIDAIAKGKLDLANISKFVKLEDNSKLAGLVWADIFAKGKMKALQEQQGDFTAGGFLDIKNLFYSSNAVPQPIQNGNMKVDLVNTGGIADNTSVKISTGHIEVGKDPIDFSLQLEHPMTSVDFSGAAKGRFTLDNIKQFTTLEQGTSVSGLLNTDISFKGNKTAIDKKEYDKIMISGDAGITNLKYISKDYPTGINISNCQLGFAGKEVSLKELNGNYLNTNFIGSGRFNNLIGYAMEDQSLTGNLSVTADKMNLNDWMGTDTSTTETTSSSSDPFRVPEKMNLTIDAKAGDVKYDKVDYKNINGVLLLNDETIKLQNVRTDALDGTMTFNGSYSTKTNKKTPAISINYDVKDLDVQKTFYAFNTIQKLMPIGQFLGGKLQSQLTMTGNLNGNMMPQWNTLTGKGNLLLIEGLLKKFAPLEKLANALQIDRLKSISLKEVRQYIEFANGKVLVKPFNIKIDDIEMQIGGLHGFDQSIDYLIDMKLPRKYLGSTGNNFINGLVTEATNKGIPIKLSEVIDLNVKMTGSITNPVLKIDLQKVVGDATDELKEQAKDFVQEKLDSAKARAKDTVNTIKEKVVEEAKEKLLERVFGKDTTIKKDPADSSKKKTDPAINKIKNIFTKPKKTASDTTKSEQ